MSVDASKKLPIKNRLKRLRRRRGFFIGLVISSMLSPLCSFRVEDGYSEGVLGVRFYAYQRMDMGLRTKRLGAPPHASL